MRILSRYILRLHLAPFVFAISALTFIMLLDQLGDQFGRLVGKGLEWTVIAEVFVLSMPFIIAMTLPMAVLVAVLYTFNRLAADNEITAMKANGLTLPRLMVPVLGAAVLLAGAMVWFNDTVLPESNHELQTLLSSISRKKPTFVLRERTVNEVLPSELFIQTARIDRATNEIEDVVIYDEREPTVSRTIYADAGHIAYNAEQTDLFLTLYDGVLHERSLNEPEEFQRMHFGELVMRVEEVGNRLERDELGGYRGDREMSISQMRGEVASAREQRERTARESRRFAVELTRRVLGVGDREPSGPPVPGDVPRPDEGGDDASGEGAGRGAPPIPARRPMPERPAPEEREAPEEEAPAPRPDTVDAAADTVMPADTAGRPDTADTAAADEIADTTGAAGGDTARPDTGTADTATLDSAARAEARADSALRAALDQASRNALRIGNARSVASQFRTYGTRWQSSQRRANRFAVEIQKKYSIPAACIIFVLIGAPLAVRFREGGVAMVVGLSLGFFTAYYVSLVAGEELAESLILTPFWAMWTPNVLFGAIGVYLVWRATRVG